MCHVKLQRVNSAETGGLGWHVVQALPGGLPRPYGFVVRCSDALTETLGRREFSRIPEVVELGWVAHEREECTRQPPADLRSPCEVVQL